MVHTPCEGPSLANQNKTEIGGISPEVGYKSLHYQIIIFVKVREKEAIINNVKFSMPNILIRY